MGLGEGGGGGGSGGGGGVYCLLSEYQGLSMLCKSNLSSFLYFPLSPCNRECHEKWNERGKDASALFWRSDSPGVT